VNVMNDETLEVREGAFTIARGLIMFNPTMLSDSGLEQDDNGSAASVLYRSGISQCHT
jgi:hypothetical protein